MSLLIGMLFIPSCKDECKDVTCLNGGTCEEGICTCATGYEGEFCATEMRAKFLATYTLTDGCYPTAANNDPIISVSAEGVIKVNISNILGGTLGGSAKAEVNGSNITIPGQTVTDSEGASWTIEGMSTGTMASGSFNISIKYIFGSAPAETCIMTFSKK